MGKLKLKPTGLPQPKAPRVKIGDSWILKKDYDAFLAVAKRNAERSVNNAKVAEERARCADIQSNWLYAAFALALHREYGWDAARLLRALKAVDKVAGDISSIRIDNIWKYVSQETGLTFVDDEEE